MSTSPYLFSLCLYSLLFSFPVSLYVCRSIRCNLGSSCWLCLRSSQSSIQWIPGAISPGVKRPKREADHSPSFGAEFKKDWSCVSTIPCVFMMSCVISISDNFAFTCPIYCLSVCPPVCISLSVLRQIPSKTNEDIMSYVTA